MIEINLCISIMGLECCILYKTAVILSHSEDLNCACDVIFLNRNIVTLASTACGVDNTDVQLVIVYQSTVPETLERSLKHSL